MEKAMETAIGMVFAALLLPAMAQAACSLGANPLHKQVSAVPGQTVGIAWNLYNIHGDRITHVAVSASESPGWDITYSPELHEEFYNVSGQASSIEENVGIEPMEVVDAIPGQKPDGVEYVRHPKNDGYIPVMPVDIFIKVPENAEIWKQYNFTFEAIGNCFSQPGAAVPGVAQQLEVKINTISGEYFEERITQPQETVQSGGEGQANQATGGITGFFVSNGSWIGIIVFLVVVVVYMVFSRRKHTMPYSFTPKSMAIIFLSVFMAVLLLPPAAGAVHQSFYVPATVHVKLPGDVNGDCIVNIFDLATVGLAFGSEPGDPNWNPEADLTGDGRVNIFDLATVGINFGKSCYA